jgi:hypothetical protein
MLNANPILAVLKYHSKLKKNVYYDLYITCHPPLIEMIGSPIIFGDGWLRREMGG